MVLEKALDPEQQAQFDALLARRITGEPVAYIIGEREFWSLPLKVSPSTLIPRPDTERLVEVALDKTYEQTGPILDLGTGTGAIALALASELPKRQVMGVDLKHEAKDLAEYNASQLNIKNVTFDQGSWFEPIASGTKFALIVSNPPYIDEKIHISRKVMCVLSQNRHSLRMRMAWRIFAISLISLVNIWKKMGGSRLNMVMTKAKLFVRS